MACRYLLIYFYFSLLISAGEPKTWRPATVTNIDVGGYSRVSGYNGSISTRHRKLWTYSFDDGERVFEAQREGKNVLVGVEVNGHAEIAVEKNHVFLKLPSGKEEKLSLVKATKKP